MSFDIASFAMGKASGGGGGGGGGTLSEEWDFTSATPLVGIKRGITLTQKNVTFDANGAAFASTQSGIAYGSLVGGNMFFSTVIIEAKVKTMALTSSDHRRFIMGTPENGLVYRSTGAWGFYSDGWEQFSETDGELFSNSVIKVVIDDTNHWHIYKDDVLLWEPTRSLLITNGYVGSTSQTINNVVIEWLKIETWTA